MSYKKYLLPLILVSIPLSLAAEEKPQRDLFAQETLTDERFGAMSAEDYQKNHEDYGALTKIDSDLAQAYSQRHQDEADPDKGKLSRTLQKIRELESKRKGVQASIEGRYAQHPEESHHAQIPPAPIDPYATNQ